MFGNKEKITVQYEGKVSELDDKELVNFKEIYFQKTPSAKKYETHPDQAYLKINPTWIRYIDYNTNPETIFEITF